MQKNTIKNRFRNCFSNLFFLSILASCGGGSAAFSAEEPKLPGAPHIKPELPAAPQPVQPSKPELPPAPKPDLPPVKAASFQCAAGTITCLEVRSTSPHHQSNVPVTFGQPFSAGDWKPAIQGLIAQVDGKNIPLQADEISSHRDGSARFAVLSAQLSNMQPGEARIVNLYPGPKAIHATLAPVSLDWNLEVEVTVYDASGHATATLIAQPQAQLQAQVLHQSGKRLDGPVASEYVVITAFRDTSTGLPHPHLSARFDARVLDGGARIRTDVILENTRTWAPAPGNIKYSMRIQRHGVTLHEEPPFTHYHHARWHKVVWSGAGLKPLVSVRHHMPYFMATKAVWNYDLTLQIPESVLAKKAASLEQRRQEQSAMGPMAKVMLTPAFGTTGGRPEIGPLPQWTAMYLISQDERARAVMMANADAAGSVPVHYRDEETGFPVDLDHHPLIALWIIRKQSQPKLPEEVEGKTIWKADMSHQASLSYVPYLLTGDGFYQEEMMFWAAWNMAALNPEYRGRSAGLLHPEQVRGQAWAMRALREAAHALPDRHPMKPYFRKRLENNLQWFYEAYITQPHARRSPMGASFDSFMGSRTAPWQGDYMGLVFAQLAENNEPHAAEVLQWISRFNVGRVTSDAKGFCAAAAPGYFWEIKDKNGNFISSWADLYAINYPDAVGKSCSSLSVTAGYPKWAGGYASTIRAMLAATANAGVPEARAAFQKWKSMTPEIDKDYSNDPTWAIVPRE